MADSQGWPYWLANRLAQLAAKGGPRFSIVNMGISGNRVTQDTPTAGVSAEHRLQRDVLDQTGLEAVLVMEGINDIGAGVAKAPLIDGLTHIVTRVRGAGAGILLSPLTPAETRPRRPSTARTTRVPTGSRSATRSTTGSVARGVAPARRSTSTACSRTRRLPTTSCSPTTPATTCTPTSPVSRRWRSASIWRPSSSSSGPPGPRRRPARAVRPRLTRTSGQSALAPAAGPSPSTSAARAADPAQVPRLDQRSPSLGRRPPARQRSHQPHGTPQGSGRRAHHRDHSRRAHAARHAALPDLSVLLRAQGIPDARGDAATVDRAAALRATWSSRVARRRWR